MMTLDGMDDGWKPIDDDAPKTGHVWLCDAEKRMAWESHEGVAFKPTAIWDVEAAYWRPGEPA
jgi:hypothetical protein